MKIKLSTGLNNPDYYQLINWLDLYAIKYSILWQITDAVGEYRIYQAELKNEEDYLALTLAINPLKIRIKNSDQIHNLKSES